MAPEPVTPSWYEGLDGRAGGRISARSNSFSATRRATRGRCAPLDEQDVALEDLGGHLGALATATERIQLSTVVTGNTYRQPTHLTKAVTALDVVSGGRAVLGIGANWFELEHRFFAC